MSGNVNYKVPQGNPDITGPSPIIWADCPVLDFIADPASGFHSFISLSDAGLVVDSSVDGYVFGGTNADVDKRGDDAIDLETGGADNDSVFVAQAAKMKPGLSSGKKFWFECLVASDDVGDSGFVVGLIETAGQTEEAIADDAAALIDEDYIVFRAVTGDDDGMDIEINQGGSGNFPVVVKEEAQILAAGTYYRFGITFDGLQTLKFYVDGVLVATYDVDGLDNDTMANKLGLYIGGKTGTAAAESWLLKWSRMAGQL